MCIFCDWCNLQVKKLDCLDIKLIKLATAAFVLLLAKFFPILISFDWFMYVIVIFVAAIRPYKKVFCFDKKSENKKK